MYTAAILGSLFGLIAGLQGIWYTTAATYLATFNIAGIYGVSHAPWVFNTSGGGWNAGKITLIDAAAEATLGGSGVWIDTSKIPQELNGNFFSETVGWVTMTGVQLNPPADMSAITPWTMIGYAWSDNAGYIDFQAQNNTYSWVGYVPGTRTLSGYAWSDNLGYIAFTGSGGQSFTNRIKVLGNIGGSKSFDTEYALGTKFDSVNTTSMVNSVKKNIALATRSLTANYINTSASADVIFKDFKYYKWNMNVYVNAAKLSTIASLIVEWGDVYISADVPKNTTKPQAIIVIKDATGKGGNIYVAEGVKNIYSSLIAEGTVYSWVWPNTALYNDTASKLSQLPVTQLYIYGSVISRNTIGGSAKSPVVCPFTETACTGWVSYRYDWNYFRTYDGKAANRSAKTGYDGYSVIIESDPRITQTPPIGMAP